MTACHVDPLKNNKINSTKSPRKAGDTMDFSGLAAWASLHSCVCFPTQYESASVYINSPKSKDVFRP